jgi:hypothetical protein
LSPGFTYGSPQRVRLNYVVILRRLWGICPGISFRIFGMERNTDISGGK